MGTNYYAKIEYAVNENSVTEKLHIGKQPGGWNFLFRAQPLRNIFSVSDWMQFITKNNLCVVNEYGNEMTEEESVDWIMKFGQPTIGAETQKIYNKHTEWYDPSGWHFSDHEFS